MQLVAAIATESQRGMAMMVGLQWVVVRYTQIHIATKIILVKLAVREYPSNLGWH